MEPELTSNTNPLKYVLEESGDLLLIENHPDEHCYETAQLVSSLCCPMEEISVEARSLSERCIVCLNANRRSIFLAGMVLVGLIGMIFAKTGIDIGNSLLQKIGFSCMVVAIFCGTIAKFV